MSRHLPLFPPVRGGAPANKLAELDTCAGTETQHCHLAHQAVADVVLTRIRAALNADAPRGPTMFLPLYLGSPKGMPRHSQCF
jgi:hypothetical protein